MPTDSASSARSDRLSCGEGTTTTEAASSASARSVSDSIPAKRTDGSSGSGISLTPMSTSVASPCSALVAVEVLHQLLAALAGIDASAVQRERSEQPMPPAEGLAAPAHPLAVAVALVRCFLVAVGQPARVASSLPGCGWNCGRSTPQPTVSSASAAMSNVAFRKRRSTSVL